VGWIKLAQGSEKWRALLNTVMKLRVPQVGLAVSLSASHERLCSMQLVSVTNFITIMSQVISPKYGPESGWRAECQKLSPSEQITSCVIVVTSAQ
jgi:hypothetical protein